jgi:hypothetical protein
MAHGRRSSRLALPLLVGALALLAIGCSPEGELPLSPASPAVPAAPARLADPNPGARGEWSGDTWESCHLRNDFNDVDRDGLTETCEFGLAAAFAPFMAMYPDCIWDPHAPGGARLGGDYDFAVQAVGSIIRIAYLPAYYKDCGSTLGWDGAYFPSGSHDGDSELILVDVAFSSISQHWETQRVFYSAHCGESAKGIPVDENCRWLVPEPPSYSFAPPVLFQEKWLGAPKIWVSEKKHANYPSRDSCNSGGDPMGFADVCPIGSYLRRFPILYARQNIGSGDYPFPARSGNSTGALGGNDCVTPTSFSEPNRLRELNPDAFDGTYRECFWRGWQDAASVFRGWLSHTGNTSTPYSLSLANYAGFTTGQSIPVVEQSGVLVQGMEWVRPGATCSYNAFPTAGTGPFTYQWSVDWNLRGTDEMISVRNISGPTHIEVVVTDAMGAMRSGSLDVNVSSSAGQCFTDGGLN